VIKLVQNSISKEEINSLCEWLQTDPRLTKGELTVQFEKEFAEFVGSKHAVFVNSGSSANLIALYTLLLRYFPDYQEYREKIKVIVPALSWITTVSPVIQFGMQPILCDCDRATLGLDVEHLERLILQHNPKVVMCVHVLGWPADIVKIRNMCEHYGALLIEDTCESMGCRWNNKCLGTAGNVGTYSFYYGHLATTIEGGMLVTNDEAIYDLAIMLRSHSWLREFSAEKQKKLYDLYGLDEFQGLFSFFFPGFNLRSTDLQAFLGLGQLKRLPAMNEQRMENTKLYDRLIENDFWKVNMSREAYTASQAYPIITRTPKQRKKIVEDLKENGVETRPLIAGSIGRQPFWIDRFGVTNLKMADLVHNNGLYVPNNHQITEEEIKKVCSVVNRNIL
jgi:CDP-6-deoxy-D-xylo-4-hexulose-3-dehydrase